MNTERSPSGGWSPHTAALHRRRRVDDKEKNKLMDSLGGLDLQDDDADDYLKSPGSQGSKPKLGGSRTRKMESPVKKTTGKKSVSAKEEKKQTLEETIAKYPASTRAKLRKIMDERTPMKERLEMEVEMMKDPEERKAFTEFRYKADRKTYLVKKIETEEDVEEQLTKNLSEEAKRAAAEKKEMERKRQEKVEEEIAKRERERKLKEDVRKHKAQTIAKDAEDLRKEAENLVRAAQTNKSKKEMAEKEIEDAIRDFREGEGKYLPDVQRVLKEAMIEQRITASYDDL